MAHRMGCYWAPQHGQNIGLDYIRRLQPPVIRILGEDVQHISDAHVAAPDAIIIPRVWRLDDDNGRATRELAADPTGAGQRHAIQMIDLLDSWRIQASERGLPYPNQDQIFVASANEPNQGASYEQIAEYAIAFGKTCEANGEVAVLLCLGVGHPATPPPDLVNWGAFLPLQPVLDSGEHWINLHAYHQVEGPQHNDDYPYLAGRHHSCPLRAPIVIGECGVDGTIFDRNPQWGWQDYHMQPEVYAAQLEEAHGLLDSRVVAMLPFSTGWHGREWKGYDTGPAHEQILSWVANYQDEPGDLEPPVTPPEPPVTDDFDKAMDWVFRWEGGFQDDPKDPGNYHNGKLIGTKWGISAKSWGDHYDIPNLTEAQAKQIYRKHYWELSGAGDLEWPLSLLVFDTAVLHGLGTARNWLRQVGPNPYTFAARRLRSYVGSQNWHYFGAGWVNRTIALLEEMA